MEGRESEPNRHTQVVYSCWPAGPGGAMLCGLGLIVVGVAILAEALVPDSSQFVWGGGLLLLGLWVVVRALLGIDRWP